MVFVTSSLMIASGIYVSLAGKPKDNAEYTVNATKNCEYQCGEFMETATRTRLTPNNQAKSNILSAPPTSIFGFMEAMRPGILGGTESKMATTARQF